MTPRVMRHDGDIIVTTWTNAWAWHGGEGGKGCVIAATKRENQGVVSKFGVGGRAGGRRAKEGREKEMRMKLRMEGNKR